MIELKFDDIFIYLHTIYERDEWTPADSKYRAYALHNVAR